MGSASGTIAQFSCAENLATRKVDARKFSEFAKSELGQSLLYVLQENHLKFADLAEMTENQLVYLFEAIRVKSEKEKEKADKMEREMEREKSKMKGASSRGSKHRPRSMR